MYILFYSQNHCCGAKDPNDWNLNVYFNCSESHHSREKCGVPFSCCISDPAVGSFLLHSSYFHHKKYCLKENIVLPSQRPSTLKTSFACCGLEKLCRMYFVIAWFKTLFHILWGKKVMWIWNNIFG